MADTGAVAALLHQFIETVDRHASGGVGFQTQVSSQPKAMAEKQDRMKIFEQRLAKLKPEDCDEFHRMLKEMHEAS
jgi:hypothetical protein